jgi:hypothetical protein
MSSVIISKELCKNYSDFSVEILKELNESDKCKDLKLLNYIGEEKKKYSQYRGIIINNNNRIICPSFGYVEDKKLENLEDKSYWRFFPSYEGTVVRLYYYNNEWLLSTHKKLSAFHSRWASRFSFGEIFIRYIKDLYNINLTDKNIFNWFTDRIDKESVYFFLLRSNSQNRIICNKEISKNERCILMSVYKNNKFYLNSEDYIFNNDILNEFSKMKEIRTDLKDKLHAVNPFESQGFIGFSTCDNKVIKVLSDEYKNWLDIRGNNLNLRHRYLDLRSEPEKIEKLYYLYPNYSQAFDELDEIFHKISRNIYSKYISRYIQKQYITVPNSEFNVIKKCHKWYLEDKKNNKIFSNKILFYMDNLPLYLKIQLLNNYYNTHNSFQKQFLDNINH